MIRQFFDKIRVRLYQYRLPCMVLGAAFTLLFLFFWPSIVISIQPGELGVLYSRFFGGTVLDRTYREGVHFIPPWNILFIYDIRVQEDTQEVDVLTVDGLTVKVQASMRYQIIHDQLPILHQQIGPDYKRKIILPIMTSAVRQTVGSYRPDALYSTARQELQDKMLVDASEELGRIPIIVHGFVVKKIELPTLLADAIVNKLMAEQEYLRYIYLIAQAREEAKRKAIEGQGIRYYQSLINANMTSNFLRYEGIKATNKLAASENAKVVVVGGGKDGLPLILNLSDSAQQDSPDKPANVLPTSAKEQQVPTASANDTQNMRIGAEQFDWKKQEQEFVDFLRRLDATLLNPQKSDEKTP